VELSPGEAVLLLSPSQLDALARSAGDLLRQEYGVDTFALPFMPERLGPGEEGHDIPTAAGSPGPRRKSRASPPRGACHHLAGRRIGTVGRHGGCFAAAHGLFQLLKPSPIPARKFVVLIHAREDADTPGRF